MADTQPKIRLNIHPTPFCSFSLPGVKICFFYVHSTGQYTAYSTDVQRAQDVMHIPKLCQLAAFLPTVTDVGNWEMEKCTCHKQFWKSDSIYPLDWWCCGKYQSGLSIWHPEHACLEVLTLYTEMCRIVKAIRYTEQAGKAYWNTWLCLKLFL